MVRGRVIDWHTHLLARRHAGEWFEAMGHYGIDVCLTMTPLEEAVGLAKDWGDRLHFIAIPRWASKDMDEWHRRLEAFHNLGSRVIKFHMAPRTMFERGWRLDSPEMVKLIEEAISRGMILMSHVGDPDLWYAKQYADPKYGTREEHYRIWTDVLRAYRHWPWVGAHLGGNPENLPRLQALLDEFPNLYLDLSATKWMVRELSARRDPAREFIIRNASRLLFGSDQVSGDDRGFDFLASRLWVHRKLWETGWEGDVPIHDPDLPDNAQPVLRGLALPTAVLQKIYHDNAIGLLERVGVRQW
jgi:hypothetical protein